MRQINVKINDDKTVELSNEFVGYVEESKATQLVIMLNTELQSSDINYHLVNFRHGENDEKMISQKIYRKEVAEESESYRDEDKIILVLPQYVTRYQTVHVQVEGHIIKEDMAKGEKTIDTIIKSPVFVMKLDESIVGEGGEISDKVEGVFADIYDLQVKLEEVQPIIDIIKDGIEWEDIHGSSKPKIANGDGRNSIKIGDTDTSFAFGNYSATIGSNLTVYGDHSLMVGKYGIANEGMMFTVADGTEDNPKLLFEVSKGDSSFYVKLYGITPALTAPEHAIPTVQWVKNYIGSVVYPKYDADISTMLSDISELKNDLPEGLDQVSNEVLEVRDSLQSQILSNKPLVSDKLVLTKSGWVLNGNGKYTQTVLLSVNVNRRNEIDAEIESLEEWGNCFVIAVSEQSNGIVFEANSLPSKDLSFRITSTEVNYAV